MKTHRITKVITIIFVLIFTVLGNTLAVENEWSKHPESTDKRFTKKIDKYTVANHVNAYQAIMYTFYHAEGDYDSYVIIELYTFKNSIDSEPALIEELARFRYDGTTPKDIHVNYLDPQRFTKYKKIYAQ